MQQTKSDKTRQSKERKNVAQEEIDRWRKKVAPARNIVARADDGIEIPQSSEIIENLDGSAVKRSMLPHIPGAIATLAAIAMNPNARDVDRIQAAKALMDRAGFNPPRAQAHAPDERDLASMSADQLRSFVQSAQRALSDRAKVIDSAPMPGANDIQATDNADDLTA